MTITADIKFELPEALREPSVVQDFFPPKMFQRVVEAVKATGMGTDEHPFHTMLARWEAPIQFDDDIEEYCVARAREIFGDDTLKKAYFFAVRYQKKDGCIPHLWEHVDQNGTQTTIDITVENTAEWGIIVEGQEFKQEPNNAIIFAGQQHIHSRPPYPTYREDVWTTVLFLHFTQPNHWIQSNERGIYDYGIDGDARFFNRNRFMALPDVPLNQPVCACHDYVHTLNLYDKFVGHEVDTSPELVDMSIRSKEELAPGIFKYSIAPESARLLRGLVQNAMYKQWQPAEILSETGDFAVDYAARNCYNYFLTGVQSSCHPQDPIRRAGESLSQGIDAAVEDFRGRYSIVPLVSHHTVLLRYEPGNLFHNHIDDHPRFPRVVSVSLFLNDNYEGGELEFKEFGLKIVPKAGDMVVFCSGFPYMHQVTAVTRGIRYAVVKWYDYSR